MDVFLERSELIVGDLDTEVLPSRSFNHTAENLGVSLELLHTIDKFAELEMPFPAREPQSGRSLYALTDPETDTEITGLKMKGALGIKYQADIKKFIWCKSEPLLPYRSDVQLHISLNAELKIELKESKAKAMYCLPAKQALNEFECQNRLAKSGLGFRGLAAGEFIVNSSGIHDRDFMNRRTGAVFIEHEEGFKPLTRELMFIAIDLPNGEVLVRLPENRQCVDKKAVISQTKKDLRLIEAVGAVKVRSAVEAGIARHSAQPDNFWYGHNKILVTDTDSCLLYDEMNPVMKGPQLLRDAASDMLHCLTAVSNFAYSQPYRDGIENETLKPFHSFMRGFFGKYAETSEIEARASLLHRKYCDFLKENEASLYIISEYLRQGILTGKFEYPVGVISDTWNRQHYPLLKDILAVFYEQLKNSRLQTMGFSVPEMKSEDVSRQFNEGIDKYLAAIHERVLASQHE